MYWYTQRVSAIKWSSSVAVKSLLYGSLFGNTMCEIIHQLLKWYSKIIKLIQHTVEICQLKSIKIN
jgi:hypothetical protein